MLKQKMTRTETDPAVGCRTSPTQGLSAKPENCLNQKPSPQPQRTKLGDLSRHGRKHLINHGAWIRPMIPANNEQNIKPPLALTESGPAPL